MKVGDFGLATQVGSSGRKTMLGQCSVTSSLFLQTVFSLFSTTCLSNEIVGSLIFMFYATATSYNLVIDLS